jgi:two-component system chemotaxis response regulator CheY
VNRAKQFLLLKFLQEIKMQKPNIVCVDDQREVLATLKKDLDGFLNFFKIEYCESAEEAYEIIEEIDEKGENLALLICDHIMPVSNGIDFLIEVDNDIRFQKTKKLLLTGLATHQDTIIAINNANIDYYVEKPWESADLINAVKHLLTKYILTSSIDYSEFISILDQELLYKELRIKN